MEIQPGEPSESSSDHEINLKDVNID